VTVARLAHFMSANGLRLDGCRLFAPNGENVGIVRHVRGGPLALLVFQETYRLPAQAGQNGSQVTAWWPAFRPAWAIAASDGTLEVGETLGPDEVICDLCNADITTRPVPVVGGYAYCAACFAGLGIPFPGRVQPYPVASYEEDAEAGDEQRAL
jgi:hypothetical protein